MTKIGQSLYQLCNKWAKFIAQNKWLYYFLSYTWGLLMTSIGLLASLILIIKKYKAKKYNETFYFNIGHFWGGVTLGNIFFKCYESGEYVKSHEYGHSIQNTLFGPFMPFIVGIPSLSRYLWRRNHISKTPYESIWFEKSATSCGEIYNKYKG